MSTFGSYTREQLREAYSDAWRKQLAAAPLSPLEAMLADVIGLHPEYQPIVQDSERALGLDPGAGADNPFLHMGLHMAVREQLSIDRPPGVRQLPLERAARVGDAHRAEHVLMESLAETLWEAQRAGRPPDEVRYLALARHRAAGGTAT